MAVLSTWSSNDASFLYSVVPSSFCQSTIHQKRWDCQSYFLPVAGVLVTACVYALLSFLDTFLLKCPFVEAPLQQCSQLKLKLTYSMKCSYSLKKIKKTIGDKKLVTAKNRTNFDFSLISNFHLTLLLLLLEYFSRANSLNSPHSIAVVLLSCLTGKLCHSQSQHPTAFTSNLTLHNEDLVREREKERDIGTIYFLSNFVWSGVTSRHSCCSIKF